MELKIAHTIITKEQKKRKKQYEKRHFYLERDREREGKE